MSNFEEYPLDANDVYVNGDPNLRYPQPPPSGGTDLDSLDSSTNESSDNDLFVTKEDGGTAWVKKSFLKIWNYIKSKIQASSNEVAYGTCTTAAGTATKDVTLDTAGNWTLKKGCRVCVKFTNTNTFSATAESPCKLNVNNTGAKNIYWGNSGNPTGTNTTAFGRANYINEYVYDGTYWVWCGSSADNNTTYSAMSTSEMTTGTATNQRTMRADYLKAGLKALCAFKFFSMWTYKVEIVSSTDSGQIVWIFTPNGYITLTTSGQSINFSVANIQNISKWTYTRDTTNKLKITLNCTDHTPMFIFANDNNISVTFTDTSTPQSNTISNWKINESYASDSLKVIDTRNDNQTPQWYMTNYSKRLSQEFKASSAIGVNSIISGIYCTLLTFTPWNDSSGGLPYQIALGSSGVSAYRVASSTTEWGTWNRVYTTDTTYGVVSKTANGLAPQLPDETTTTKYLRQDGTWVVPPDTKKGNGITTNAAKTGSGTTVTSTIAANTTMDNAIGTLLNNDVALNASLANKQDKLTNPLTKSDVVNNLTTTTTNVPLSAAQGKVLNDKISNMNGVVISTVDVAANTITNIATSAGQYLLFATSTTNKYRSITFANIHATDNNVCYSSKFVENHDGNGGTMTVYTTANLLRVNCTVKCRVRVMRIGSSNY